MKTTTDKNTGIVTVSGEFDGIMISAQGATVSQAMDRMVDRMVFMVKFKAGCRDNMLRANRRPGSMVDVRV